MRLKNLINAIQFQWKQGQTWNEVHSKIDKSLVIKAFESPQTDFFFKTLRQLGIFGDPETRPYSNNPWVFASLSAISTNISAVPRILRNKAGEAILEHKALDIINRPNPNLLGFQFIEGIILHLDLNGEAFVYMPNRNSITQFEAPLYILDPNRFEPLLVKDEIIKDNISVRGWMYSPQIGSKVFIDPIKLIHFKYFNPDNPFRGLSRWESAKKGIQQDALATEFNINYFKHGAVMSGVIEYPIDQILTDDQFNRIKNQFHDDHEGVSNAFNTFLVEGGGQFKPLDIKLKDMAFGELKKMSRSEVFAVFNTNPVVLGLFEDVKSEEGTKTAIKMWWNQSLIPRIRLIEGTFNSEIFRWIEGGRFTLDLDTTQIKALQADMKDSILIVKELAQLGYPMNHLNEKFELNLDKFDWLDAWWLKGQATPIQSIEDGQVPVPEPEPEPEPTPDPEDESEDDDKGVPPLAIQKAQATAKWHNYFEKQQVQERIFEKKTKTWLFKQRKKVLKNLEEMFKKKGVTFTSWGKAIIPQIHSKGMATQLLNPADEVDFLIGTYEVLYFDALETGAVMISEELGSSAFFAFEPLKEEMLGKVTKRITRIPETIVNTINNKLEKELSQGIAQGEGVGALGKRIRGVYNFEERRILTIARTESATMINEGRFAEMKREGIEFNEWVTARDDNVRDSHESQDSDIVRVGAEFANGLQFPNDPSGSAEEVINCRCLVIPVENKSDKF